MLCATILTLAMMTGLHTVKNNLKKKVDTIAQQCYSVCTTNKEGNMFAVVDFDRQKSHSSSPDFQTASDFITQYPVIDNTVVVDLSESRPQAELL